MSDNDYSDSKLDRSRSRSPIGSDEDRDRDRSRRNDRKRFDRTQSRVGGGGGGGGGRRANPDRRVYVSNIPYEYKWQDLKDLFRQQVGEVAYVEIFNDENNRPRGCAIIEFDNSELAAKAIETMHRYELKGRRLVVKEDFDTDRDRHGRLLKEGGRMGMARNNFDNRGSSGMMQGGMNQGMPGMGQQKNWGNTYGLSIQFLESLGITPPLVNKVFVANLDYKVDDAMLKDVFKMAGKVIGGEISKDQDGKSRGFGVVEFEHPVECVQAISMLNNQTYYERILSVRMDRREKQNNESSSSKLPQGLKGLGMGLGVNGIPITDISSQDHIQQLGLTTNMPSNSTPNVPNLPSMNMGLNNISPAMNNNMQMNNLAAINPLANLNSTNMATMQQQMGNMGNMASNLNSNMMNMNNMNNMGMSNQANLNSNMAANLSSNTGIGGMGQNMLAASNTGLSNAFSVNNNYNNNMGGGGGGGRNDFINSSSGSNFSSSRNVIQISNLPHNYTWQSLRDMCREYGEIGYAEMRSKGVGTIRFQREADAQRAVDILDRQRCDGRMLDVRLV